MPKLKKKHASSHDVGLSKLVALLTPKGRPICAYLGSQKRDLLYSLDSLDGICWCNPTPEVT